LLAIIDYNRIQSFGRVDDVLALEPLADKWRAWGWQVSDVDGHDHSALLEAIGDERIPLGQPRVIIANTTKGKGVSFMEDRLEWHYRSPNHKQLEQALTELGEM
jgi:transketolase